MLCMCGYHQLRKIFPRKCASHFGVDTPCAFRLIAQDWGPQTLGWGDPRVSCASWVAPWDKFSGIYGNKHWYSLVTAGDEMGPRILAAGRLPKHPLDKLN